MFFRQTIKNLNRIRQILQVLVKYGFEDVITSTSLKTLVPKGRQVNWSRQNKPVFEYTRWERIRMVIEELGPTYIKFAQVMSNRPDVLPEPLINELVKLQNEVPTVPFATIKETIESEFGKQTSELFDYLMEKPIGSASIGQVHRARLKSGEEVVVKVRRPKVRQVVETDISILREVVSRASNYLERMGLTSAMDLIDVLDDTMQKELDYRVEERNIRQFRNFYEDRKDFYVPKSYRELTTEQILVVEFANGCKITDKPQLQAWALEPKEIARRGMHIYLTQVFEFGFFHADPHPGNIIIQDDGVICLIDFGMTGKMNKIDKFSFAGIFIGMAQRNPRKMAINFRRLATSHEIEDRRRFEHDLNLLIEDFADLDVQEGNIAELGRRIQQIIYDYKMKVPASVFLILRALAILEGIGKSISPDLNAFEEVKPYGLKLIREQYSLPNLAEELNMRLSNFDHLLRNMPLELNDILKRIRQGKLHIETEHSGYEDLLHRLDRIGNMVVMTLLAGALFIAASLALNSTDQMASLWGMPTVSLIGYAMAAFLCFFIGISLLRK